MARDRSCSKKTSSRRNASKKKLAKFNKEQEKHKASLGRRKDTNNKEVCVYYNNGTSTVHKSVTQCAKDIGIHRDTVYTIINNIKSKKQEELDIKCIKYLKAD